jgi:hypothetical protein
MPAVMDIMIFCFAGSAHMEVVHGSIIPVIRQGGLNRITWPAVQAGCESIAISPVGRIVDLFPAAITDSDIGRKKKIGFSISYGVNDTEPFILLLFDFGDKMFSYYRVDRRILNDVLIKFFCFFFVCIDGNMYAVIGIAHTAAELHIFCHSAYIGPESNTLYYSFNMYMKGLHVYTS